MTLFIRKQQDKQQDLAIAAQTNANHFGQVGDLDAGYLERARQETRLALNGNTRRMRWADLEQPDGGWELDLRGGEYVKVRRVMLEADL